MTNQISCVSNYFYTADKSVLGAALVVTKIVLFASAAFCSLAFTHQIPFVVGWIGLGTGILSFAMLIALAACPHQSTHPGLSVQAADPLPFKTRKQLQDFINKQAPSILQSVTAVNFDQTLRQHLHIANLASIMSWNSNDGFVITAGPTNKIQIHAFFGKSCISIFFVVSKNNKLLIPACDKETLQSQLNALEAKDLQALLYAAIKILGTQANQFTIQTSATTTLTLPIQH